MNDNYLADEDYSQVQSIEDIRKLLAEAQTPGPSKYNFQDDNHESFEDMIDEAIEDEYHVNEQSFNPRQYQHQAVVQQHAGG